MNQDAINISHQPKSSKAHPHAAFIAEALKDTSRDIQGRISDDKKWLSFTITEVVDARGGWQFRFADTKPECVSPLSDEDLAKIGHIDLTNIEARRAIANAAHRAAYKQVAELPSVTSLGKSAVGAIFSEYDDAGRGRIAVANAAIVEFQRALLKQLGE